MEKNLTLNEITKGGINYLTVFGGYAAGRLIDGFISKKIVPPVTQQMAGLGLGVETTSLSMKLISPIVLLVGAVIINQKTKNESLKLASIGLGVSGAEQAVKVITGKESLFGIALGDILDNTIDGNMNEPIQVDLDLPELSGSDDDDLNGQQVDDDDLNGQQVDDDDINGQQITEYSEVEDFEIN